MNGLRREHFDKTLFSLLSLDSLLHEVEQTGAVLSQEATAEMKSSCHCAGECVEMLPVETGQHQQDHQDDV